MKKKINMILMLAVMLCMLVACASKSEQTTEVLEDTNYPLTIVDQAGREVVIEKKPEKLVSSYYITTSALIALGLEDEIKGIESNPEKRPLYSMCAPELLQVTQVGSPKEFDLEACASIEPDLVILPMRAKDMVEPLERLNITVMFVNPEGLDEILEMISLIGTATGVNDRAEQLISYIKEKNNYLSEKLQGIEQPTVYLGGNSSFLSTASKGMYQNDQISLAGGTNVAGEIDDTYWVESSYEQILAWNPEAIILASDAKYSLDEVLSDTNLSFCQAITNQRVYKLPSDIEAWDSPVPASFLGAVYMANVLHPDVVSYEEYEAMVKEFYETFYGFSYEE